MKPNKYTIIQIEKAVLKTFQQMDKIREEKTIVGKNGPWDVSQKDWDDCSFTYQNIVDLIINNLK